MKCSEDSNSGRWFTIAIALPHLPTSLPTSLPTPKATSRDGGQRDVCQVRRHLHPQQGADRSHRRLSHQHGRGHSAVLRHRLVREVRHRPAQVIAQQAGGLDLLERHRVQPHGGADGDRPDTIWSLWKCLLFTAGR